MPIPLIIAGLAASAVGVAGHLSAKETNERAETICRQAQCIYNEEKEMLESLQKETELSLIKLGDNKVQVLNDSMNRFVNNYSKVQLVEINYSTGLSELSRLTMDKQDVLQIAQMNDIYSSTIASGATGAATGAAIALAASGNLVVVTSGIELAGVALSVGEIGSAVGIAGSALSLGASLTPFAAVAAPVVMFTGISASLKADENLEKANAMYAESEAAVEKMKVSETLCKGITKKSDMFNDVLNELNSMFSECTILLDQLIRKKEKRLSKKQFTSDDFSENDLRLLAVTGSLAKAVKSIIDTPILTKEGMLSTESSGVYDSITTSLHDFKDEVTEVKTLEFDNIPVNELKTNENIVLPPIPKMSKVKCSNEVSENKSKFYYINRAMAILLVLFALISVICGQFISAIIWILFALSFTSLVNLKFRIIVRWIFFTFMCLAAIGLLLSDMVIGAVCIIVVGILLCPKITKIN